MRRTCDFVHRSMAQREADRIATPADFTSKDRTCNDKRQSELRNPIDTQKHTHRHLQRRKLPYNYKAEQQRCTFRLAMHKFLRTQYRYFFFFLLFWASAHMFWYDLRPLRCIWTKTKRTTLRKIGLFLKSEKVSESIPFLTRTTSRTRHHR